MAKTLVLLKVGVIGLFVFILAHPAHADRIKHRLKGHVQVEEADDFSNHTSKRRVSITDSSTGKTYDLETEDTALSPEISNKIRKLRSGDSVDLTGVESTSASGASGAISTSSVQVLAAGTQAVTGTRKTLAILVDFADASLICTSTEVNNIVFGSTNSVDKLYREMSYGALSITGITTSPVRITARSNDNCDMTTWRAQADAAAKAAGYKLNDYPNKLYAFPYNPNCSFGGIASTGGNWASVLGNNCRVPDTIAHEIGHTLGMSHASSATEEYGDDTDIMGGPWGLLRHVNAPHKIQMGWMSSSTPSSGTTVDIAPLELNPQSASSPQVVRISKPDTVENYYVSYRQRIGYDSNLFSFLTEGVSIHRWGADKTYHLVNLGDGQSFTDTANQVTITQMSHGSSGASVRIQYLCDAKPPSITVSPASLTITPGQTAQFTVTVKNLNPASCPAYKYSLYTQNSSAFYSTITPSSVTLSSGQSTTAIYKLPSTTSTAPGTYPVMVMTAAKANAAPMASGSASLIVSNEQPTLSCPATLSPLPSTATRNDKVAYAYCLVLRRAADTAGLTYYASSSYTIAQILQLFFVSTEFRNKYFGGASYTTVNVTTFVNALYSNILYRAADSGGLTFYVNEITAGRKTRDAVIWEFINSPEMLTRHGYLLR